MLSLQQCIYGAEISTCRHKVAPLCIQDEPVNNQVNLQELPEDELWLLDTILPRLIAMIIIMIIITAVQECVIGLVCVVEKANMKHLVMTGKEHRLPRAVFATFKHVPITLFFF